MIYPLLTQSGRSHERQDAIRANQLASFALLAYLGSVQCTARTQLNQKTKKNSDKDTGKLAYGKVLSKPRPIAITIDSPTKTFRI